MNTEQNMKKGAHSLVKNIMIQAEPKDTELHLTIGEDCIIDGTIMILHGIMKI